MNWLQKIFLISFLTFQFCWATNHVGMWVVRHALKSRTDISNIITTANQLQVNTLYVQVYALGRSYWDSEYLSESRIAGVSDALLSFLIKEAHLYNIEVYAWINIFYVWGAEEFPPEINHPVNLYRNSIIRIDTSQNIPEYSYLKKTGNEGYYIDPSDEQYLHRVKLMIGELLDQYRFDGIHFDYFRYPRGTFLHSITGRTKFMMDHYFDPLEFCKHIQVGLDNPKFNITQRDLYTSFRRDNLTAFLRKIRESFGRTKPIISIAVKPNRYQALTQYGQDWKHWLDNDLCQQVMLMNYNTDMNQFCRNIRSAESDQKLLKKVIVGVSVYNQSPHAVTDRIRYLKENPAGGIAYFSYNYLIENPTYLDEFLQLLKH